MFIVINGGTVTATASRWLQVGANSKQGIYLAFVDATAKGLGLEHISVLSHTEASSTLETIDKSLNIISKYRSYFGSIQNRLEYTIKTDTINA